MLGLDLDQACRNTVGSAAQAADLKTPRKSFQGNAKSPELPLDDIQKALK